ncbi:protein kinase [Exophiala oligosperma]
MAVPVIADNDLINFDIIETHKENIQSLPGGRSAKQLAAILTPRPSGRPGLQSEPTLNETKTLNNAIRQEYEIELQSIADADDPLDIYDRYVKWTLNSYPSAQATPESQLLPLLERATKAFLTSSLYKNDPRYLKLWLHYIRLFSDSPRETFAFLARHGIGDALGLFYEEFAAWLEGAGRWMQADEVFKLGIEKEARPTERLIRKYNQFQQRFEARPQADNEPSSPALPTVRPALAAKIDPFASAHRSEDAQASQQQQQQQNGAGGRPTTSRSGKPKMAIFSDADNAAPPPAAMTTNGWDNIGSIKERKKENTIEARPWTGEKMKAGGRAGTVPKMEIFKDPSLQTINGARQPVQRPGDVVNPRTGRIERVFVNIEAIYPSNDQEFSFEELRATSRGWFRRDWRQPEGPSEGGPLQALSGNEASPPKPRSKASKALEQEDIENLSESFQQKVDLNDTSQGNLSIHDVSTQSMVGMPESQSTSQSQPQSQKPREKKYKVREVKQETQTVKTRLQSPTGKKLKRKITAEPTMTFHSKAATNEIYDMFNQPLRKPEIAKEDTQSGEEIEFTEDVDDGYSTTGDAESTGTGREFGADSEYGEDTLASQFDHAESQSQTQSHSQPDSVSPWSDFTASKHVPRLDSRNTSSTKPNPSSNKAHGRMKSKNKHRHVMADDVTESLDSSSQNATQTSGLGGDFDTQAIAAIANCNFDDMDTKAIAMMAGDVDDEEQDDLEIQDHLPASSHSETEGAAEEGMAAQHQQQETMDEDDDDNRDSLSTPVDDVFTEHHEISHKPRFIPLPPEDYEPTPVRPYRDRALVAQNKLPFMTPIVERTESSLAPSTVFNDPDYFTSKTPSRSTHAYESPSQVQIDKLLMSSPQQQDATPPSSAKRKYEHTGITEEEVASSSPRQRKGPGRDRPNSNGHIPFPIAKASPAPITDEESVFQTPAVPVKSPAKSIIPPTIKHKGPIVADLQCNPCDDVIRQQVLTAVHPPVSSYSGYYDHSAQALGQYSLLKSYAEKISKLKAKGSPRKSQGSKDAAIKAVPPLLKFAGASRVYAVKRELGAGAFAPVYLVESYDPNDNALAIVDDVEDKENSSPKKPMEFTRQGLEALKTEAPPGTLVWEFHILRTVRQRLGPAARTMQSIVLAQECHLFSDEAYIVLEYSPQGTLLDLVNLARNENVKAGKPAEGLEEVLAMWFGVELLRSLEDLHQVGILHGDLKGDNCLVRFSGTDVTGPYDSLGGSGWNEKGLKLIDFGRGIDTRMFKADAQFIADWPSCATDCAEIRECKPWKWQIDYHGAAGVIHSLLFGKYIETVPVGGGLGPGQKKEWKLKENLKRYWEKEIWTEVFGVLLNPATVQDGEEMPVQRNLKRVRTRMEKWLSEEGERSGRDLRGALRKMERLVAGNKSA